MGRAHFGIPELIVAGIAVVLGLDMRIVIIVLLIRSAPHLPPAWGNSGHALPGCPQPTASTDRFGRHCGHRHAAPAESQ